MPDLSDHLSSAKIDPLHGILIERPSQPEPKPQVVFEDQKTPEQEELEMLQKQREFMELRDKAARTKFASGDPDRDIHNYKVFRGVIDSLMDLME